VRWALNVQNVFDERYISTGVKQNSAVIPGEARKVFLSVNFAL